MKKWVFLAMAMLVAFIASGNRMLYGVFVLPVSAGFALTRSEAVLPLSLSAIVWGVAQPFAGSFMDTFGPRKVILASMFMMAGGFVASAVSHNILQLTLGYGILVGAASGGLATTAFGLLISRRFTQQQRGRAIGIGLAGIPLGTLAFAPFISFMANNWDWRTAFMVMASIIVFVGVPLTWIFLKEPEKTPGAETLSLKSGSLFTGEVLKAVKTRAYWLLLLAYFGCGSTGQFIQVHLPSIGQEHGFSPQVGALGLGMVGAGGAVGAIIGGWASDRFGRYQVLIVGYSMRALGFFLMAFFATTPTSFYMIALLAGIPMFMTVSVTQAVVYEVFGTKIAGRMLGLIFILHQVGATLGPYVGGRIFDATGSYQTAMFIATGVLAFSALCSWLLKQSAKRQAPVAVEAEPQVARGTT